MDILKITKARHNVRQDNGKKLILKRDMLIKVLGEKLVGWICCYC